MTKHLVTRRAALSLLAAVPFAARVGVQSQTRRLRRIFSGRYHDFLLDPEGTLKCWSNPAAQTPNAKGELGQGHVNGLKPYTLYSIPGLANVVSAGAGWDSSFAVLADGRIFAWGERGAGILGITPLAEVEVSGQARANTSTPTPVAVRFDAVDISVGADHVLALARDGTVWAWGAGGQGRLGNGPLPVINFKTRTPGAMSFVPFPMRIPGLSDVIAVSAGTDHSLALLKDGTVLAWGGNKRGQLGDGTTVDRATPVPVKGLGKVVAISASDVLSVVVLAGGTVWAWGGDGNGVLGRPPWNGSDGNANPLPRIVPGVAGARAVSASVGSVMVLTQTGTVISWGFNGYGNLGQGTTTGTVGQPPAVIKGLTGVQSVTTCASKGIAVLDDGRIFIWGGKVRPWVRLDGGPSGGSPSPILLSLEGLENPR
ncbi:MAG: hypothetical protein WBD07_18380 [Vicinamibacterales bacterium]